MICKRASTARSNNPKVHCNIPLQLFAFSILNWKISNENATHCSACLPWLIKNNLGLDQLVLKMHAFSACINGVLQLSFSNSLARICTLRIRRKKIKKE
jgi:hypothetical protein